MTAMLGTNFRQRFAGCPQKQPRSPGKGFSRLSDAGEVTELLREWSEGKPDALERLFDVVYPHLRQIAEVLFRGERPENACRPVPSTTC